MRLHILILLLTLVHATSAFSQEGGQGSNHRAVVYIGDSQATQTFGRTFDRLLRTAFGDDEVQSYAQCGASVGSWLNGTTHRCGHYIERRPNEETLRVRRPRRTPHLQSLLVQHTPQYVFISLGGNHTGHYAAQLARDVDRMVSLIVDAGAQCFWMGPPHGRPHRTIPSHKLQRSEIGPTIEAALEGRCAYFNSWAVTQYPLGRGDGIHYDSLGALGRVMGENWATAAFAYFSSLISRL